MGLNLGFRIPFQATFLPSRFTLVFKVGTAATATVFFAAASTLLCGIRGGYSYLLVMQTTIIAAKAAKLNPKRQTLGTPNIKFEVTPLLLLP